MAGRYYGRQLLNSITFKSFEFPYNPSTSTYDAERVYASHKYPNIAGEELEDMDLGTITITGSGEFIGDGAYDLWNDLNDVFRTDGDGKLYHPIFTDVKRAVMTKLRATVEPREDYVAYEFEFKNHTKPAAPTKVKRPTTKSSGGSSKPTGDFRIGETVFVSGIGYHTSYGNPPTTAKVENRRGIITNINMKGTHQIHIDSFGWFNISNVRR